MDAGQTANDLWPTVRSRRRVWSVHPSADRLDPRVTVEHRFGRLDTGARSVSRGGSSDPRGRSVGRSVGGVPRRRVCDAFFRLVCPRERAICDHATDRPSARDSRRHDNSRGVAACTAWSTRAASRQRGLDDARGRVRRWTQDATDDSISDVSPSNEMPPNVRPRRARAAVHRPSSPDHVYTSKPRDTQ